MNVPGSSISVLDRRNVQNAAKFRLFLIVELRSFVTTRQLQQWKRQQRKAKCLKRYQLKFSAQFCSHFGSLCFKLWHCLLTILVGCVIESLLIQGGVELNPGPPGVVGQERECFQLLSQNCRGLTDRSKLIRLLRKIYSPQRKGSVTIACLQEIHKVDNFAIKNLFNGTAIMDEGDRNQRGVCILVPEGFEVCGSRSSGIGRWIIAVLKIKDLDNQKLVLSNIYAPNDHRESVGFYREFFRELDEVIESMVLQNESFESAIIGDFNVVLDRVAGASNRVGSRPEIELASLVTEAMIDRSMVEPVEFQRENSHTWRRGNCLSKLDYVFLSRALQAKQSRAHLRWYEFGAFYDHASLRVSFRKDLTTMKGRSFPKLFKSDIKLEADRRWLADQLGQIEAQIPQGWDPHTRLDFVKMMLRSKTLELRQMRKFSDDGVAIRDEISNIIKVTPLSVNEASRLDMLKLKLYDLEEREAEINSIRAGVKWREEGEKSTAYFLARFKARSEATVMYSLNLGTRVVRGTENILSVVKQFYGRLYNAVKLLKLGDLTLCDRFFSMCPRLELQQQQLLSRPLCMIELKESLKTCVDSAPGLDGIPYSFYAAFPDFLLKYLLDSWNYALSTGNLARSHRRSCISLLPKKGKDLDLIGNWRPISLSACDLKIITKAYANRLKQVLPGILCEAQAAYIPGRDISFNNRLLQIAKAYAVKHNKDYCVVSLDAKKAFDSVSHAYLVKVLETYGFPPEFITIFKVLYADLESVVQVNGMLSQPFRISNGVKQGDALSCGLFVLAIDPLIRNILDNPHIEGLSIPISPMELGEIKIVAYADDVTIVCKNENLQPIFDEYELFSQLSGLELNADKTEVFNLIRSPMVSSTVRYLGKAIVIGRVEALKVCGIWLDRSPLEEYRANVLSRIEQMELIVMGWGRRHLTLNGRMILAKTFLLSLIVFPAQVVAIQKKEIKKIERLIYAFVNGAKSLYGPERISRRYLKAPKIQGGINGVDVESFIKSIVIRQYVKAAKSHRGLREFQASLTQSFDSISEGATEAFKSNCKRHASDFPLPDIRELELISGIPLVAMLGPKSKALGYAKENFIVSLSDLQISVQRQSLTRNKVECLLKSLPNSIAVLIRGNGLVQAPTRHVWFSAFGIKLAENLTSREIRMDLFAAKFPDSGVKIERIYKRPDWPPPGREYESDFARIWLIKNPSLRAVRLKVIYKDIFSNERRFRFKIALSSDCEVCGMVETVDHHLFSCSNANRVWRLYRQVTGSQIESLFDVISCGSDRVHEIIKSVCLKALLQIDRSKNVTDRAILAQCLYFLNIEARAVVPGKFAEKLKQYVEKIKGFV